ncbi:non-specific lipid-transfer protein 1-like [Typha latifolia]|uniref:non-specific lipid-transfer protein 1-like n=1 Tax=Typha latifolia TaxID=4733 RepID=UPI003C2C7A4A
MKVVTLSTLILLLITITHFSANRTLALTCSELEIRLSPCLPYLTGLRPEPAALCCDGVRWLEEMTRTTTDRKTACNCMAAAAARLLYLSIRDEFVSSLPGECAVSLSYPISLSSDCSKIP